MNLINNDTNIKEMYNYHLNELDKNSYNKYLKYLSIFYSKDTKKDKYNKEFINDTLILIDKTNPKKKIEVKPAQFINIHLIYNELKESCELILYKINNLINNNNNITENDRKEFDELKQKYILYKNKLKDIDYINKEYYDEMEILFSENIEKSNNLAKFYQKRNENYANIKVHIKESLKNTLIQYYKENKKKIPSLSIINKIAKSNDVPSNEIEKWFYWIESVYQYILVQKELNDLNEKIKNKEEEFYLTTKYMIIKKPEIIE
jgi:hypothetical protein